MKLLLKFYGEEFKGFFEMVTFVNDLFFFGFTKQLIETLTELGRICKGEYKGITQIKLLNTISIILTQKTSHFPLGLDNLKKPKESRPSEMPDRRGSEASTVQEEGVGRKNSLDTTAFNQDEEFKDTMRDGEGETSTLVDESTRFLRD